MKLTFGRGSRTPRGLPNSVRYAHSVRQPQSPLLKPYTVTYVSEHLLPLTPV
jgi:hypothetical protein